MAFKIPDWLLKTGRFLQSGKEDPLNPYVRDISGVFSAYENGSPLETAFRPAMGERFAPTRTIPEDIPGAPVSEIPRMDMNKFAMPVGQGSWFNRRYTPAGVQSISKREELAEAKRQAEQASINEFLLKNPGLAEKGPFATLKDAQRAKEKMDKELAEAPAKAARLVGVNLTNAQKAAALKKSREAANPFVGRTTAAGGAATDTKVVAGKTFKRINNAWVQQ